MNEYMQFARNDQTGTEVCVLVLDRSPSMEDDDWQPSRLSGAKEAACALLDVKAEQYENDLVGVVAFGSRADVLHQPAPVGQCLQELQQAIFRFSTRGGTNIKAGIEKASAMLAGTEAYRPSLTKSLANSIARFMYDEPVDQAIETVHKNRRMIILTDGHHNMGGSPVHAAKQAKDTGVCVDVIGIGGNPKAVCERTLKQVASVDADGSSRYRFIGDKEELATQFRRLAHHLKVV